MTVDSIVHSSSIYRAVLSAGIGAIFGVIICQSLLIHIVYHFFQLRKAKKNKPRPHFISFYLMIAYLVLSTLVCLTVCLIRMNIITNINASQFTDLQCSIGYFSNYALFVISKAFMFHLFNWRIQILFKESAHLQYPLKVHVLLYIIPWYNMVFSCVCLFIGQFIENENHFAWTLYGSSSRYAYVLFCGGSSDLPLFIQIFTWHSGIVEVSMSMALLYMFVFGLYQVYKDTLDDHTKEHIRIVTSSNENDTKNVDAENATEVTILQSAHAQQPSTSEAQQPSTSEIMAKGISSPCIVEKKSILRIIQIRNVMQKQALLVSVALVTSMLYWVMFNVWAPVSLQSGWDISVNAVCMWLMFGCSQSVFNCISRYVCCNLCYHDVQ